VPSNFNIASGLSKKAVLGGGTNPVAVGDVYCVKMKAGGYAWFQITGAGIVLGGSAVEAPSFSFRVNTTQNYCGYEQTTADVAASSVHGTPTPYAPQFVITPSVFAGTNYGVAVSPSNAAATMILVADASLNTNTGYVRAFNPTGTPGAVFTGSSYPAGVAVNSTGTTLFVGDPNAHMVRAYSMSVTSLIGSVGPGIQAPLIDTALAATAAQMASPEYVALDPSGNVYLTDAGTNGFADVMVIDAPTNTSSAALTYWNGQIGSGTNSAGIATDGLTVYIADANKNQIETYNVNGLSKNTWTTDNNPTGAMAFSAPQGIALDSSLGLLFIADTGNNRIVELTTLGAYKASWGTWGLGGVAPPTMSGPTGIAVDGANPPNVYVSDSGNKRVLGFKGL
jgi:hypothetical protein